jgi:hypothetical protein
VVASGSQSTLLVFNHSQKQQAFSVRIIVGGIVWEKRYSAQPMETKTINIADVIQQQEKDDGEQELPANATSGTAEWYTGAVGAIKARVLVSNAASSMTVSPDSCYALVPVYAGGITPNPLYVPVGSSGEVQFTGVVWDLIYGSDCGGTYYGTDINSQITWGINDTSIATLGLLG